MLDSWQTKFRYESCELLGMKKGNNVTHGKQNLYI